MNFVSDFVWLISFSTSPSSSSAVESLLYSTAESYSSTSFFHKNWSQNEEHYSEPVFSRDIIQRGLTAFATLSTGSATAVGLNYGIENNVLPIGHTLFFLSGKQHDHFNARFITFKLLYFSLRYL
jgi:hypothetical protein